MSKTAIEWSDKVWNPVTGCTRVSAGCDKCYAVVMTKRLASMGKEKYSGLVNVGKDHFNGVVRCHEDALLIPLKWKKPCRVFVNSMSDLFHKDVPFEFICKVFETMYDCGPTYHYKKRWGITDWSDGKFWPGLTFQILTKRPERAAEFLNEVWPEHKEECLDPEILDWWKYDYGHEMPHVWIGTSVEDQKAADERIPHLLRCPAAVRFLSVEPLLGAVDIAKYLFASCEHCDGSGCGSDGELDWDCVECRGTGLDYDTRLGDLDWAIVGGESGEGHRPMPMFAFNELCTQVIGAGVPLFVKQDSGRYPGNQWRISEKWWGYKQFPEVGGQ